MGLIVDTNVFIDIENNRLSHDALTQYRAFGRTYLAAISVSELLVGVHLAKTPTQRIKREAYVESLLARMEIIGFDSRVARTYAHLHGHYLKPRKQASPGAHDLLIASTAITFGYPVLTSNRQDFIKIPGLEVLVP
ncbi:MAG: type II toxin-antitoxin system VapC family toxin [Endozoicomonas sp.]|uniref:type II toxin-antitoxin system VapC family toxin n=1 Tax=Endozoicomonas sp. TaxID=1892382 RepID=UPI003D9BBE56